MKIELIVIGLEREEQIEDAFQRLLRLRVLAVDLVDDDDGLQPQLQRLGQHEFGLRHDGFRRIHQQHYAIHHGENTLHLAAEIGVTGRVHDVDAGALPIDRGAFRQNGNAALALQIVGIERPLLHVLIVAHGARLPQQLVHQRGLPMVDMGDDGDVADVHGAGGSGKRALIYGRLPRSNRRNRRRNPAASSHRDTRRRRNRVLGRRLRCTELPRFRGLSGFHSVRNVLNRPIAPVLSKAAKGAGLAQPTCRAGAGTV